LGFGGDLNEQVEVGTSTPWVGLATTKNLSPQLINGGNDTGIPDSTISAHSDFIIQGTPNNAGNGFNTFNLGSGAGGATSGFIKIDTGTFAAGNIKVFIQGNVALNNDNAEYGGDTGKVTFVVTPGATLTLAQSFAMG